MGNLLSRWYTWYWKEYRCRLECFTWEWRRYTKRWWWVALIKLILGIAIGSWVLLFPASHAQPWIKILILIAVILVGGFYAWVLLHLGSFALRIWNKIKEVLDV